MANVKITQLPLATTPLTGTEDIPLVQGTTTKQVTVTGLFTSPVMTNPTLGTVGQADLINATGLPISTGVAGLGAGIATFLGTPSSANLRTAVTDETGSGSLVFANAPVLVAPNLGTPTFLVATNATGTAVGLTAGSAITNANLTGAVTSVGNATSLGSFTSAQLRTALTDETGAGVAVFATSPTITAPILNQINDTNNAQILGLSPTTSAVDYLVVKNGIGVGVPLHFYADGASANIGLHIQPKGTGLVTISDGTDFNKGIRFRSSSSAASAITLLDAVSTAGRVVTLPDATTTLVGRDTTDTLTNKTIAFSSNTFSGTLAIANGGTNASTAASAIENLLPAYTGNGSKALKLNSGATALEWITDGGGTVTSVGGTGTVNGITLTGTVTTSGNLTLGGTLSGVSLTSQVTGVLPTANGGTNLTSFTSGGVVYASSSSALATGSALVFDGTNLGIGTASPAQKVDVVGTQGRIRLDPTNVSGVCVINFTDVAASVFGVGALSASELRFNTNGTEGFRLTSSSLYTASGINVGIGHSNPLYKLDVNGTSNITTTAAGSAGAILGYQAFSAGVIGNHDTADAWQWKWAVLGASGGGGTGLNTRFSLLRSVKSQATDLETLTVDSLGNLGLGVTPSAWTTNFGIKGFNISNGALYGANNDMNVLFNSYFDGTNFIYSTTAVATKYTQGPSGQHQWFTAPSGTAGNPISFTQAMTLDASGNLALGKTSAGYRFDLQGAAGENQTLAGFFSGTNTARGLTIGLSAGGTGVNDAFAVYNATITGGYAGHIWQAGGTERARIDSSGNLLVGTTSTGQGTKLVVKGAGDIWSYGPDNSGGTTFYVINNSGVGVGLSTGNTSWSAISDERLKNIKEPITNAVEKLSTLRSVYGNYKTDSDDVSRLFLIAQDVQKVFPEVIDTAEDELKTLSLRSTDLIPVLVKAIQEQQAMIESLRQRLSAANL